MVQYVHALVVSQRKRLRAAAAFKMMRVCAHLLTYLLVTIQLELVHVPLPAKHTRQTWQLPAADQRGQRWSRFFLFRNRSDYSLLEYRFCITTL